MERMKIKVAVVILDYKFYPRMDISNFQVSCMVEAMQGGAVMPPITVNKKTMQLVDGAHRCRAALKFHGPNAMIDAVLKTYKNDEEMFLDCVKMNSHHGVNLDKYDRVHCALVAEELGIREGLVAEALNMPLERFRKLIAERTAMLGDTKVPTKPQSAPTSVGSKITKQQYETIRKASGLRPEIHIGYLLRLIRDNLIDRKNEKLVGKLRELHSMLGKFLKKKPRIKK